ncbi:MAG: hypothetical protein IPH48_16465 [bacterium]|nr:hypothetical protein [bacterium]
MPVPNALSAPPFQPAMLLAVPSDCVGCENEPPATRRPANVVIAST